MDEHKDMEQILHALEKLGLNVGVERFKTEAYHLTTLFEQGKTVTEALNTVSDPRMRAQLKPFLYCATLRSLILVAARLHAITSEQASDLADFLNGSILVLTKHPAEDNVEQSQ